MIRCHPQARECPECCGTSAGKGMCLENGGGVHAGTRKEEPVTKRLCRDPSLAPGWTVYWRPLVASLIFIFHLVRNSF